MIYNEIENFPKQFAWSPEIMNAAALHEAKKFVVVGMGGSNLAAGLIKSLRPELDITIRRDYGLPIMNDEAKAETLFILSSYSGNTEEVLAALEIVRKEKLNAAVIAAGGKLLEAARAEGLPHIEIPEKNIQPRMAFGYSFLAHLKLFGLDELIYDARPLSADLNMPACKREGERIAEAVHGRIPLIYSSARNYGLAYNWKVRLNETGKTPAFINFLPELAHNELAGFDPALPDGLRNFCAVFLLDEDDDPRIMKKMTKISGVLEKSGVPSVFVLNNATEKLARIFSSILIADWTAYHIAKRYGVDPDAMTMIENFKKAV
jgi:glucose/mannose-6-phosphate isomerase